MPNTIKYRINSKKSLCKSKKEKKCKKIKGCKMAKGPKKTFCRKIKNKKYGKTIKKRGGMDFKSLADSPMAQQFSKEMPSVDSLKDSAKTLLIGPAKEELKQMLKQNKINLEEKDLDKILDEISKLEKAEIILLLEDLKKAVESGDENEIIQTLTKNEELRGVRGIGLKIMRKNPVLMKQVRASLGGGNKLKEHELQSLERTYQLATPDELEKIMNDESKDIEERSIAQKILMEKLKF